MRQMTVLVVPKLIHVCCQLVDLTLLLMDQHWVALTLLVYGLA